MSRPEIGKIFLVDKNGGIVCSAMYRLHPMLRERDVVMGGKVYQQTRQTAEGQWVYIEIEPTTAPDTPFIDSFDYPDLPPPQEVTIKMAYDLIDEMQKGASLSKLADLRSVLEALQVKASEEERMRLTRG